MFKLIWLLDYLLKLYYWSALKKQFEYFSNIYILNYSIT